MSGRIMDMKTLPLVSAWALAAGLAASSLPGSASASTSAPSTSTIAGPDTGHAAFEAVHYRVAFEAHDGRLAALDVTMSIPAQVGEQITLDLPALVTADRVAAGLAVEGAQAVSSAAPSSAASATASPTDDKLSVRATAASVVLHYRLRSDGSDSLIADQPNPQRNPALRNGWFGVKGEQALALPEGYDRAAATLDYDGVPAGWLATTSVSGPATVADLADTLLIGGRNYHLATRAVGAATLRLAYPDGLKDSVADLLHASSRVLMAEWAFWREPPKPFFIGLVQMKYSGDYGGRGLHGGFALYMGSSVARDQWLHLIAHENLHTWISRRIGGYPAHDDDLEAWLNEGFTEAYTARILLDAGLWTPAQFVADWNHALVRYGASPLRDAPNARILAERHTNPDVEWLPYDRGRILAVLWDRQLRDASHGRVGLDDVMRAQIAQAAANAAKGDVASADVLLPVMVHRVAGVDLADEIARHVDRGELPLLPEDAFGKCIRVVAVTRPVFDHGFDFVATMKAHGHVTGLEPGGPADRAGLREGDRLHVDECYSNDSSVALNYGVDNADGTRRQVSFKPEGAGLVTIQQLELRQPPGATDCEGMATP